MKSTELVHESSLESTQPILPTLPMDDLDFRKITSDFIDRLDSRLDQIERAVADANFDMVCSEAHWLKGAGGTVGLPVFTQPAAALEQAAKCKSRDESVGLLHTIRALRERIVIPALDQASTTQPKSKPQSATARDQKIRSVTSNSTHELANDETAPIHSTLPTDDAEFCAIIADFVVRLDRRFVDMRDCLNGRDFDQLADLAHWLKGAGGTVGYVEFTQPAMRLVESARAADVEQSRDCLQQLESIRQRLVVPNVTCT